MTNAIQKMEAPQPMYSQEEIALIKRQCMPSDASDAELKMFLHTAKKSGLDPLTKQIYCTRRGGRLVIQASIDGMQARAHRFPDFRGIAHSAVCAKDKVVFDAKAQLIKEHEFNPFSDRGAIMGAWATVTREGFTPFHVNVLMSEYGQTNNPMWRSMPAVMIDKVAKHSALRLAFPEAFGGIYGAEELGETLPMSTAARLVGEQRERSKSTVASLKEGLKAQLGVANLERVGPKKAPLPVSTKVDLVDVISEEPPPPTDDDAPPKQVISTPDGDLVDADTGEIVETTQPRAKKTPAVVESHETVDRSDATRVGFGSCNGQYLCDLSDRDLRWYHKVAVENVEAKKFLNKSKPWLEQVESEIKRRKQ